MGLNWLDKAITNNAEWCSAIARSHGHAGVQTQDAWYCLEEMPPFYPNLVTLRTTTNIPDEVRLVESKIPSGWGLKDSFAALDLEARGFETLLEAQWYTRQPGQWAGAMTANVSCVKTDGQLAGWVHAWADTPPGSSIFTPRLLEDESVRLLYSERNGTVVAGLATNLSDSVVGISNAFGEPRGVLACIRHSAEQFPSRSIVGYGGEDELSSLASFGFQSLGPLKVWLRN